MNRFLLLAVLTVFVIGCSHETPKPAKGTEPALPKPATTFSEGPTEKDLPKAMGIPLYPGAKVTSSKLATAPDQPAGEKRYHVTLTSKDSPKQIAEFYKFHGIPAAYKGDQAQAMGMTKGGAQVIIEVTMKDKVSTINMKVITGAGHG